MSTPSIGILGGVGAIASARFHLDLVQRWAKTHDAKTDDDFPRIMHVSQSLGLAATGVTDKHETSRAVLAALWPLFDCNRIAVLCNSVTTLLPRSYPLAPKLLTPVAACRDALKDVRKAWLLASESTIRDEIYQRAYPEIEWNCMSATPMIQEAIAGRRHGNPLAGFQVGEGKKPIVLGCTELSTAHLDWPNTISPTDEMIRILCLT